MAVVGMKPYTILHCIDTPGPGGAETVVVELASRLDPKRFRSLAGVTEGSWAAKGLAERGVPISFLDPKSYRLPGNLAEVIRQEQVDLVHSHLPDMNFYSCLGTRWAGCKAVVTYHGPVELSHSRRWRNAFKLWAVRNLATAVVVVCDFVGHMLVETGFPPDKVIRIYNGINPETFPAKNGRGHLRQQLGLEDGDKLIGMVANVRQTKGYEFFIEAAKQVASCHPKVRFVAVGDIDPVLAQPLYRLLDELALRQRFHFLGFRDDVPEVLNDLDIFVLSSTAEGFPLVTLEAMAAGKPVVVTRCGGPQEVVDDGNTGCLVPPGDSQALAAKISGLLTDPRKAAELGANARYKVANEFSISKMVMQYESLYEKLVRDS